MKFFDLEFKFNGFDLWHKGNFSPSKVATSNNFNDLDNKPSSLPANGGNSDTVDGKHANDLAPLAGVSGSWTTGKIIHNVARCLITATPTEILIKTGIPFVSSSHMPVIHIEGYAYGLQSPIELKIGYYIYNNTHGWCGAVSMGAWKPIIKLFSYIGSDGSTKYTGIALIGNIYYPQFSVSVQTEMGGLYSTGWTIENNSANNTVYNMPSTDVVTVPYKSTFSQKINGVTFDGISDITITANPNAHTHSKTDITDFPTSLPASGGTANAINFLDTRSSNLGGFDYKGITIHLKGNGTDGLSDGGTYHGVVHITQWGDISGGKSHELAFTDNGNVWYRDWNGAWSTWVRIAKISDIPTKVSQLTNDSNFATTSQIPTKLSQLTNDIGAGGGIKITTAPTAPSSTSPGDFWYKEL